MGDLGVLTQTGDDVVLTFRRRFNHPAEKVWRAVTEEEHLATWFPQKIKGEWRAGAPLRFESDGGDGFEGEVIAFDPPSMLELMSTATCVVGPKYSSPRMIATRPAMIWKTPARPTSHDANQTQPTHAVISCGSFLLIT